MQFSRLSHFCFLFIILTNALAQDFLFLSDRIPRLEVQADAESYTGQMDVFVYRSGSEVRLTYTDDVSEFDPVPSPDGRYLAVASSSFVYPRPLEVSSWHYSVIDTLLSREVARFEMPASLGSLRPAGGFQITWLPDGSAFLAHVPKENFEWSIYRFDVQALSSEFVTDGFGISLNRDASKLATSLDGLVHVVDLISLERVDLIEGEPFAWTTDEDLLIARPNSFRLIDSGTGEGQELFDFFGFYSGFAWSPDFENYAFILSQQETWFVVAVTSEHAFIDEYKLPGVIDSVDWLSRDTLVVSYLKESGDFAIIELKVDGTRRTLVDSWVHDYGIRVTR